MSAVIVILTRSPSDPRIKARLASMVPAEDGRRELALAFLDDLVARARTVAGAAVRIAVTPPVEGIRIARPALTGDMLVAQRGATFGDRLHHVLEDLARSGFSEIIMLGADVPDLPRAHLEDALKALAQDPLTVVTGPSDDGSFYLLGLTARGGTVPNLFSSVRWGTPYMLEDTEEAAGGLGLGVQQVSPWPDVDVAADLVALVDRLRYAPAAAPHTAAVLKTLGLIS